MGLACSPCVNFGIDTTLDKSCHDDYAFPPDHSVLNVLFQLSASVLGCIWVTSRFSYAWGYYTGGEPDISIIIHKTDLLACSNCISVQIAPKATIEINFVLNFFVSFRHKNY